MLPPRGNIPTRLIQQQARNSAVDAGFSESVHRGRLRSVVGRGIDPGTPRVNGIYMRDGSFQTFRKFGMKWGNTSPLR